MATATDLECWIYWFLHAHEYEPEVLRRLFPQPAIQKATDALVKIRDITEDKEMYDAQERARRDQRAILNDAHRKGLAEGELEGERKGKLEGKIEMIRTLQSILRVPVGDDGELRALDLSQLEAMTSELQEKLRNRMVS